MVSLRPCVLEGGGGGGCVWLQEQHCYLADEIKAARVCSGNTVPISPGAAVPAGSPAAADAGSAAGTAGAVP